VFEAMAESGEYDVLVQVHDFPYRSMAAEVATADEVTRALLDATRDRPSLLPVYVSLTSGDPPPETKAVLDEGGDGAPLLRGAREAFRAIGSMARWTRRHEARRATGPWRTAWPALAADTTAYGWDRASLRAARSIAESGRPLSERESLDLLRAAGIAVTAAAPVTDAAGAVDAARAFGAGPVVLKVDAAGLPHKSDLGLVRLGLRGEEEVRVAAAELLATAASNGIDAHGLLVEPMAVAGVELIIGARRDASFGPCVMVGLGGVLAEVLDDVAIRLAPVPVEVAMAMLDELRGAALLSGVRGKPPVDRRALARLVADIGRFLIGRPDVIEIDLNPVIATPAGAVAVDALVVVDG
jgi:acyl-CoA synthetase (NDP forming)